MKRIAIAAAAALLMMGTAQAQTAANASPLYGEVGYSFLNVDGGGASADVQALRGIIGYNAHPYFAVEGLVGLGTSSDSSNVDVLGTPVHVKTKVSNTFGVFLKPKYEINNFELFGRLGWASTKLKLKATANGVSDSASDSDSDFAYGVGVNYNLNPRTYVGVDYMRFYDKGDTKIDGVTVSVGFRF
jgi:opacity protein-like surface antigen